MADDAQPFRALDFFFTPVDEARPGVENPHAKASTHVPDVIEAVRERFGADVGDVAEYAGEQTLYVARERIADVCRFLKDEMAFVYLTDVGGVDRFTDEERFEVFYNLVSFERQKRLRLKVRVPEEDPVVPTITEVYRSANWNEREVYDMLGIRFEDHPDMRRMYMPEDFEYFPQRKEFPLLGVPGSLPLPAQTPEGELEYDPFPAARGRKPPKSFLEPRSKIESGTP
jgi:NADH-quinone oxidoreductase subunit C